MSPAKIAFEDLKKSNGPLEGALERAFREVVEAGVYINGHQLSAFELEFSTLMGLGHAAGVGSGYDALTLAFQALDLPAGEVILPSNTYMATALAVARAGLVPVFAEPAPETFLLDPEDVKKRLTARTVAILPVHLFGLPCDMGALCEIAGAHNLAIVEDCAQAHGTVYADRSVGTFGNAACWSFYPTKNLGALGDGGAVTSRSPEVIERIRVLRNYGAGSRAVAEFVGMNSRLDELQAAFLRAKLAELPFLCARKNEISRLYDEALKPCFVRPSPVAGGTPARSVYPLLHPGRDEIRSALEAQGIGVSIHYPVPPYRQKPLLCYARGSYPIADMMHERTFSLPLSTSLTDEEVERVVRAVNALG